MKSRSPGSRDRRVNYQCRPELFLHQYLRVRFCNKKDLLSRDGQPVFYGLKYKR